MAITLYVGKTIFFQINRKLIDEAFIAYLASYYLLDMDYPKAGETALTIMQWIIFDDKSVPVNIMDDTKQKFEDYLAFLI